MSVTHSGIGNFNAFALAKLRSGGAESISELFDLFLLEKPSAQESADVHVAIVEGLADIEAGKGRPALEDLAELRHKHGLNQE